VLQQLRDKFFNPIEVVWFDPNLHNHENKGFAELIKEEFKIKVNLFTKFEETIQFI